MMPSQNLKFRCCAKLLLCAPVLAFACDCANLPLLSRLGNSDAVFVGEVIAHRPQETIEFEVVEGFKNPDTRTVSIQTRPLSLCDYHFKAADTRVGDRYLVFMSQGAEGNRINRCLGTAPATSVPGEIVILRQLRSM